MSNLRLLAGERGEVAGLQAAAGRAGGLGKVPSAGAAAPPGARPTRRARRLRKRPGSAGRARPQPRAAPSVSAINSRLCLQVSGLPEAW